MEARSIVLRGRKGQRERKEGERMAVLNLLIEVHAAREDMDNWVTWLHICI